MTQINAELVGGAHDGKKLKVDAVNGMPPQSLEMLHVTGNAGEVITDDKRVFHRSIYRTDFSITPRFKAGQLTYTYRHIKDRE